MMCRFDCGRPGPTAGCSVRVTTPTCCMTRSTATACSISCRTTSKTSRSYSPCCGPKAMICCEPSCDRLLAAVRAIGYRLEAVALRGDLDASWIGLNLDRKRHWSIASAGLDLYDGVPGIALFLAYLGRVTGNDDYSALARAAL